MVITEVQRILDAHLLPHGVTSHHRKRMEVDRIGDGGVAISEDEYVVYHLVSARRGAFGDGKAGIVRQTLDVHYYHRRLSRERVRTRVQGILGAFLGDRRFHLVNGPFDLYEPDGAYTGVGIELSFLEVTHGV